MEAEKYHDGTWNTAKFNASAFLTIVAPIGFDLNTDQLETMLLGIDAQYPWRVEYVGGGRAPSMNWHSRFKMKEAPWIDRLYEIEFRPPFMIQPSQFAAYHRYACTIAEKFGELKLKGMLKVSARVEFSGGGVSYWP